MRDIPKLDDWVYEAIALNIQDMCAINDQYRIITKFTSSALPAISFSDYQKRIVKDNKCDECDDPAIHILALIYLDRMTELTGRAFFVNSLTIHRAYLACVLVASKFFSEHYHDNTAYAKLGGLQTTIEAASNHDKAEEKEIEVSKEMNRLEVEALWLLEWDLNVDISTFTAYADALKIRYDKAHISSLANGSKQQQSLPQDSKPSPPSFLFKPIDKTEVLNHADQDGDQSRRVSTPNAL